MINKRLDDIALRLLAERLANSRNFPNQTPDEIKTNLSRMQECAPVVLESNPAILTRNYERLSVTVYDFISGSKDVINVFFRDLEFWKKDEIYSLKTYGVSDGDHGYILVESIFKRLN